MPRRHHSYPLPPGWLAPGALVAAGGIDEHTLTNWRKRHLIPRPAVMPMPGGGTASRYRPETLTIIRRIKELREKDSRNANGWLWTLWLEELPVEMLPWAAERLGRWMGRQKPLTARAAEARRAVSAEDIRRYAEEHPIFDRRSINAGEEADLIDASLSAAAGDPEAMAEPAVHRTLLKVGGLAAAAFPLPEPDLIELLSLPRLAEIAAVATEDEAEQARRDCQAIARLVMAAEDIDWSATLPVIEPLVAKVTGAKTEPPSWQARKAQRKRPAAPPTIVGFLATQWRRFDNRAVMIAFLIGARRDPAGSKRITEILALAEAALFLFRTGRNTAVRGGP